MRVTMKLDNPLYCVRDVQARVLNTQVSHETDMSELDWDIEVFALDMQASDPESDTMEPPAVGYESERNMEHGQCPAQSGAYFTIGLIGARGEVPCLARDIGENYAWRPTTSEEGQA